MKSFLITVPYLIAATLVISAVLLGLSRALGAHPIWSTTTALIGAPLGLVLAILTRRTNWMQRLSAFFGILTTAAVIEHYGRLAFALSFAEDKLAGHSRFLGWIAISIMVTAFLCTLFTPKVAAA